MTEKLTGLDYQDFININVAIKTLIEDYQRMIDNGSHIADYWASEIVKLQETQAKVQDNRSYER